MSHRILTSLLVGAITAILTGCSIGDIAVEPDKPTSINTVPKDFGSATTSSTDALVTVVAYHWKSHTVLDEVAVVLEDASGNRSSDKGFTSRILPAGSYAVSVSAPAGSGSREAAIDLKDALATLKMAIGIESINGTDLTGKTIEVSAYQRAAADFNSDGRVDLKDALEILKYSIGVQVSSSARWQYFDDTEVIAAGSPPKVELARATRTVAVNATTSVGVAALLTGDVDGSWRPSQTTAQVDPTYYTNLVAGLAATDTTVTLARWGLADAGTTVTKTVISRTYQDGVETITYIDGSQVNVGATAVSSSFALDKLFEFLTYAYADKTESKSIHSTTSKSTPECIAPWTTKPSDNDFNKFNIKAFSDKKYFIAPQIWNDSGLDIRVKMEACLVSDYVVANYEFNVPCCVGGSHASPYIAYGWRDTAAAFDPSVDWMYSDPKGILPARFDALPAKIMVEYDVEASNMDGYWHLTTDMWGYGFNADRTWVCCGQLLPQPMDIHYWGTKEVPIASSYEVQFVDKNNRSWGLNRIPFDCSLGGPCSRYSVTIDLLGAAAKEKFDLVPLLNKLVELGWVRSDYGISNFNIGTEVLSGNVKVKINKFRVSAD
jgi:hypothetical protein